MKNPNSQFRRRRGLSRFTVRAATFAVAISMIKNPDALLERGCSGYSFGKS